MLQNSDYNHGKPYFVDFRPLLHSPPTDSATKNSRNTNTTTKAIDTIKTEIENEKKKAKICSNSNPNSDLPKEPA